MKIYIACALTHVPRQFFDSYVAFVHKLAETVQSRNNRHDIKYALVNSDPQLADKPFSERAKLCYLWDREMVENADVVIAEASFPSTGLGIEMQIAESKGIPILLAYRDFGQRVTHATYDIPTKQTASVRSSRQSKSWTKTTQGATRGAPPSSCQRVPSERRRLPQNDRVRN